MQWFPCFSGRATSASYASGSPGIDVLHNTSTARGSKKDRRAT